jgi:hypothetical protein
MTITEGFMAALSDEKHNTASWLFMGRSYGTQVGVLPLFISGLKSTVTK